MVAEKILTDQKNGFALKTKKPLAVAGKGVININYSMVVTILSTHKIQIRMSFTTLPKGIAYLRMTEITLPTSVTILPTHKLVFAEVVL